jgi:hypothetical protein
MNMITKNNIFERYLSEYLKATKQRKGEILNHVCDVTQMHKKSATRKFSVLQMLIKSKQESRGRPIYYTKDTDAALKIIWKAANEPCGELLHPLIEEYVNIFQRDKMWKYNNETTNKLLEMKQHTVRRRVSGFEHVQKRKGISTTKPSHLKAIIPIFKGPWDKLPPGHGQIDTVAHCGNTLLGDFVFTLNYTDSATYWIIPRAQWNKGQQATTNSMQEIKDRLPFPFLGAHPDTGSEFINWYLKDWCDKNEIALTRSEPGKKNDNMFVEERNGHVVRKYLGYTRLDCLEIVPLVNELYDILALYLNHFQAVRRTVSKERIGAKYKRIYEKNPKTPYQRVLDHPDIEDIVKAQLKATHEKLNPLILKQQIDILVSKIFKLQKLNHKPLKS